MDTMDVLADNNSEDATIEFGLETQYLIATLGDVLRTYMTELVLKRPVDPIDYLAHSLKHHAEVEQQITAEAAIEEQREAETEATPIANDASESHKLESDEIQPDPEEPPAPTEEDNQETKDEALTDQPDGSPSPHQTIQPKAVVEDGEEGKLTEADTLAESETKDATNEEERQEAETEATPIANDASESHKLESDEIQPDPEEPPALTEEDNQETKDEALTDQTSQPEEAVTEEGEERELSEADTLAESETKVDDQLEENTEVTMDDTMVADSLDFDDEPTGAIEQSKPINESIVDDEDGAPQ